MKKLRAELELEVRNLYLFEDHTPTVIAEMLGESPGYVSSIISRLGLTKLRKEVRAKALTDAAQMALEHKAKITEAMIAQSEQHALTALRKTGEALAADEPRDAVSYSGVARNLVGIARAVGGVAENSVTNQVNLFFVGAAVASEPRRVSEEHAGLLD